MAATSFPIAFQYFTNKNWGKVKRHPQYLKSRICGNIKTKGRDKWIIFIEVSLENMNHVKTGGVDSLTTSPFSFGPSLREEACEEG